LCVVVEQGLLNNRGHDTDVTKLNNIIIWSVGAVITITIILAVLFTGKKLLFLSDFCI